MFTESVTQKIHDNLHDIINMKHECTHRDFIAGLVSEASVSETYENILCSIGVKMFNVFADDYECDLTRTSSFAVGRPFGLASSLYHFPSEVTEDEVTLFARASNKYISHCYEIQNELRYIRASLVTMPCDLPVAATLKKILIDREPLNSDHVANLPVVLSFPLLMIANLESNEENKMFFTPEYVEGLMKASEDYAYPDQTALYYVSRKAIGHAIAGLYCFKLKTEKPENRKDFDFEEAYDLFGAASVVDDDRINLLTENTYYNSEERHKILNELFYNTFDIVKRSKNEQLVQSMKSDVERHAFYTVDVELEKKVVNYLKLLG